VQSERRAEKYSEKSIKKSTTGIPVVLGRRLESERRRTLCPLLAAFVVTTSKNVVCPDRSDGSRGFELSWPSELFLVSAVEINGLRFVSLRSAGFRFTGLRSTGLRSTGPSISERVLVLTASLRRLFAREWPSMCTHRRPIGTGRRRFRPTSASTSP